MQLREREGITEGGHYTGYKVGQDGLIKEGTQTLI